MAHKRTVCVDLDGVLADYAKGWQGIDTIGDPIPGAVQFTKDLSEIADILIFTTRCCEEVQRPEKAHLLRNRVREWLDRHGFAYADIWVGQGKPIASAYVDDRAVTLRPQASPGKEHGQYTLAFAQIAALVKRNKCVE